MRRLDWEDQTGRIKIVCQSILTSLSQIRRETNGFSLYMLNKTLWILENSNSFCCECSCLHLLSRTSAVASLGSLISPHFLHFQTLVQLRVFFKQAFYTVNCICTNMYFIINKNVSGVLQPDEWMVEKSSFLCVVPVLQFIRALDNTAVEQFESERPVQTSGGTTCLKHKSLCAKKTKKTWRDIKENTDSSMFISRSLLWDCIYIRYL